MIVTRGHVATAMALLKDNAAESFRDLLDTPATRDFFLASVNQITRGGAGKHMTESERERHYDEIQKQALAVYCIIAPIWIAANRKLPSISEEQFGTAMDTFDPQSDTAVTPDEYLNSFQKLNPGWHAIIMDAVGRTSEGFSRFACAAIGKALTDNLSDPLQPSAADIGGRMLDNLFG